MSLVLVVVGKSIKNAVENEVSKESTKKQELKIFEKYNPQAGVVRCPNGHANIRKALNLYANVAVDLYGIISKEEFVEIFNFY